MADKKNINNIADSIVSALAIYRNSQKQYAGIALYTNDQSCKDIISEQVCIDRIHTELDTHNLRSFATNIRIVSLSPNSENTVVTVNTCVGDVVVELIKLAPHIIATNGSLEKDEYILDVATQKKWNIGRGHYPEEKYNIYEKNYIIINEKEPDKEISYINQHVSSLHASIQYLNDRFFLMAEKGGDGFTVLIHSGQKTILRLGVSVPLNDGDRILLGSNNHHVTLVFSIMKFD